MNWSSADLVGRNLKKPTAARKRPWTVSSTARRVRTPTYVKLADRETGDRGFMAHLDQSEADVAMTFHHDWLLSGLRTLSCVDYPKLSDERSFVHGGQVTRKAAFADWSPDDHYSSGFGWSDDEYGVTVDEDVADGEGESNDEPVLAKPVAGDKTVAQLVTEYFQRGGLITRYPDYARSLTARGKKGRKLPSAWTWEEPVITRDGVKPLAPNVNDIHYMPRHMAQARCRRRWRWARDVLKAGEAKVLEDIVLHGRDGDMQVLRSGLRRLSDHYRAPDYAATTAARLLVWEQGLLQ